MVKEGRIASQDELSAALEAKGLSVAQATLSRDIKELKISKLHDESGYYYSLPVPGSLPGIGLSGDGLNDSILSIEFSGPFTVLKTRPGHANMIASIIDANSVRESAGTIAGDDTILVVIREGFGKEDMVRALGRIFSRLEAKRMN